MKKEEAAYEEALGNFLHVSPHSTKALEYLGLPQ
jgi:hypothetical protein